MAWVFVTQDCQVSQEVLAELARGDEWSYRAAVLDPTPQYRAALSESSIRFIEVAPKEWKDLRIQATPFFVIVDCNRIARAKGALGDVTTVKERLSDCCDS